MNNLNSIPLEKDPNWWWYKARLKVLSFIFENFKSVKNLSILEIGPGLGNNIEFLCNKGHLDVLEVDQNFVNYLTNNFKNSINLIYSSLNEVNKKYDVIVMLDVLEHIEYPEEFMSKCSRLLKKNGNFIISVPAYKFLWSSHDIDLKHFRRYTWRTLLKQCAGYKVLYRTGFNYISLPIRFIQLKVFRNVTSTSSNLPILEKIFLWLTNIEHTLRKLKINPKFGISLITVLTTKD